MSEKLKIRDYRYKQHSEPNLNTEELDLLPPLSKLALAILAVAGFTALSLLTTYF
ncbi:MAG: hypothetical protein H7836_11250 [Magnetococcus sp. YQC-3]